MESLEEYLMVVSISLFFFKEVESVLRLSSKVAELSESIETVSTITVVESVF